MSKTLNIPANLNLSNGEVQNAKLQNLTSTPQDATESRFWYDSVNHRPMYHNGTSATPFGSNYSGGTGITISGNEISVTNYNNLITTSQKGVANGVASLDNNGLVPTSQLPSYVDDVVETYIVSGSTEFSAGWLSLTDGGTALTPETGKIYVVLTSGSYQNKTYRWSGSTYIEISASPGQATTSTAGIAKIASGGDFILGNNKTIITPAILKAYTAPLWHGEFKNPALTVSNGGVTWNISIPYPSAYGVNIISVTVKKNDTKEVMFAPWNLGDSNRSVQIEMLASSNIAADTFTAEIIYIPINMYDIGE